MLRLSSVYSWEYLHDKILANFKGFTSESLTSMDLFQCYQNQGEAEEKPWTIEDLYNEFEKYCRSNNDLRRRLEEQNQSKQF